MSPLHHLDETAALEQRTRIDSWWYTLKATQAVEGLSGEVGERSAVRSFALPANVSKCPWAGYCLRCH